MRGLPQLSIPVWQAAQHRVLSAHAPVCTDLQGAQGSLYVGDDEAVDGGFWQRAYLNNFSTTIGGGTSQVQANIVGEHVLGLPKD